MRGCGRRAHALCWISLLTHFESKSRRRSRCSRRRLSHLCVVIGAAPCTGRASFQKQSSMWIRHAESPARQRSAQASSCRSSRSFQAICRSWFSGTELLKVVPARRLRAACDASWGVHHDDPEEQACLIAMGEATHVVTPQTAHYGWHPGSAFADQCSCSVWSTWHYLPPMLALRARVWPAGPTMRRDGAARVGRDEGRARGAEAGCGRTGG